MTHALRLGKRAFTISVVVTTIAWSIGLAAFLMPLTAQAVSAGDLIKASLPAVYYYGSDGKRYVFPNEKTYFTWYSDFSSVVTITDDELAAIPIGGNATYKPGVKMVKITTDPKVYAVSTGGSLRWVSSEAVAVALYGSAWNTMIHDIPDAFFVNYTVGSDVSAAADFDKAAVTATATSINVDKGLGATPTAATGALTVSLASSTPVANSVLTDSASADGAQALADFTNLVFTASSAGAVKVTTLKLRRTGISADTDFSNVYLYDGATRLTESSSFSSNYVTLNDASGLFTVPAGGSKTISVKADLANTSTSIAGKTFRFGLESSADVTSDAASVGGSFPVNGNYMTGAQVTDLATFTINTFTTFPATIDPGVENRELWRFNMVGANWDIGVEHIKLTVVGTVAQGDLTNLKLSIGGIQLGTTTNLNSAKEAIFDLSSAPYVITAGQTKTVQVMGDVVGGTNRAFKFTIQKMADVVAQDRNYSVYLKPNQSDSFTLVEPETGDGTNINTGKLTVTRATDSPTGYVTSGLTSATLAKFNLKATGEDIKLTSLGVRTDLDGNADDTSNLNNGKLYLDGVQVGTTTDLDTDSTAEAGGSTAWADVADAQGAGSDDDTNFTFGNSFIIPAGQTKVLSVVADVNEGDATSLTANTTITVHLNAGAASAAESTTSAANGQGQTSLASITSSAVSGLPLTVGAGTVTVIKNAGFADKSATNPTGVQGGTAVRVGSFVVTSGSGEGVEVTQIVLSDYAYPANDNMQNLKLMNNGTQIGTTIGTLNSSSSTYTFTPSPALVIGAGEQHVIDVYADFLTSATYASVTHVPFSLAANAVTATGVVSGLSANGPAAVVYTQQAYIETGGNLTVLEDAATPTAGQLTFGETDVVMAKFQLRANSAEAVRISQLSVSDDFSNTKVDAATGTLRNIRLYDGSTLLGSVASLTEANNTATPYVTFTTLDILIPKSGSKVLTVKADVSPYDTVLVTSSDHRMVIKSDYQGVLSAADTMSSETTNTIIAWGVDSGTQLTGTSLDYNDNGASIGNTDVDTYGNEFDVFKSKLTFAHHASAPSGTRAASDEETVAMFVVSNQSPGGYTARVRNLDLNVNSSGFSMNESTQVNVYKNSNYITANRLISSEFCSATDTDFCGAENFVDTTFAEASFTDLDISAGSSQTIYVTFNTSSASDDATAAAESLTVGIDTNDLNWDEDAFDGNNGTVAGVALSECPQSLPLTGKTLSYN